MKYFLMIGGSRFLKNCYRRQLASLEGQEGVSFSEGKKKKKHLPDPMKCALKAMKAAADLIDLTINYIFNITSPTPIQSSVLEWSITKWCQGFKLISGIEYYRLEALKIN